MQNVATAKTGTTVINGAITSGIRQFTAWWSAWQRHIYRWLLSNYVPWITAETLILIGLLAHSILHHVHINHDCAACVQMGQMLFEGKTPYVDFYDINPPAIFYINLLPAAMSHVLHQPLTLSFSFCVGLMVALSWAQLRVAIRRTPQRATTAENSLITLAWLAVNAVIYIRGDYGQREHLFALAYLPALAARAVCQEGGRMPRGTAIWLGVQAGIGACIKPHFVLIALAVEVCFFAYGRRWKSLFSADALAFAAVIILYLLHWLIMPQAMRDGYFHRCLPFAMHGYTAYERTLGDLIGNTPIALFLTTAAGGWFMLYISSFRRPMLLGFTSAALAGLAICYMQRKAWTYHYIPFEMAATLAAAVLVMKLGRVLAADKACRRLRMPALLWLFFAAMGGAGLAVRAVAQDGVGFERLSLERGSIEETIARHTSPGDRAIVLSTSCEPVEPLFAQLGLRLGQRCGGLWFVIPGNQAADAKTENSREIQDIVDNFREDIQSLRSKLIAVPTRTGNQGCRPEFRLSDFFHSSGLRDVALRCGYKPIASPDGWEVYVLPD